MATSKKPAVKKPVKKVVAPVAPVVPAAEPVVAEAPTLFTPETPSSENNG